MVSQMTAADKAVAQVLPPDFLARPRPGITAEKIDFANSTIPDYKNYYACILDNVLSPTECELLIKAAEATTDGVWERAQVNAGGGRQILADGTRRCGRIIYDSQPLASLIWKRIENVPEVQEILRLENRPHVFGNGPIKRKEVWVLSRPNERMRFLKYTGGEYFRAHCDGTYETPDRTERSYYTMHLYLSSASEPDAMQVDDVSSSSEIKSLQQGTTGGATIFHAITMNPVQDIPVYPVTGRILLFQHRDLLHSGDDIVSGIKYTMRTDLMYALERQ